MSSIHLGMGESIELKLELSFDEAFNGCTKEQAVMCQDSCQDCRGTGSKSAFAKPRPCQTCGGKGFKRVSIGSLQVRGNW